MTNIPANDEQTQRITDALNDAFEEGFENYSLSELEDLFEDRDPAEWL